MFSIDSIAGYRHYADRLAAEQRARAAVRARWLAFCAAWFHIGAAIANGYRPTNQERP